jgi:hypothetical protein
MLSCLGCYLTSMDKGSKTEFKLIRKCFLPLCILNIFPKKFFVKFCKFFPWIYSSYYLIIAKILETAYKYIASLSNLSNNQLLMYLTSRSIVIFAKRGSPISKEISPNYGAQNSITAFTTARYFCPSWTRLIHTITIHLTPFKII